MDRRACSVLNVLEDEQIDPAELKQLKKLLDEA